MKKILLALVVLIAARVDVMAQGCAVCTKTAAGLGEQGAKGLNAGIIYLAFLPLSIIGTVGYLWWKSNRATH